MALGRGLHCWRASINLNQGNKVMGRRPWILESLQETVSANAKKKGRRHLRLCHRLVRTTSFYNFFKNQFSWILFHLNTSVYETKYFINFFASAKNLPLLFIRFTSMFLRKRNPRSDTDHLPSKIKKRVKKISPNTNWKFSKQFYLSFKDCSVTLTDCLFLDILKLGAQSLSRDKLRISFVQCYLSPTIDLKNIT